uniref:Uncharacterized protein n=1 Tax=Glossina pallidipes TaxID=7398 RepID=A0A1B0A7R4_GLOPL
MQMIVTVIVVVFLNSIALTDNTSALSELGNVEGNPRRFVVRSFHLKDARPANIKDHLDPTVGPKVSFAVIETIFNSIMDKKLNKNEIDFSSVLLTYNKSCKSETQLQHAQDVNNYSVENYLQKKSD